MLKSLFASLFCICLYQLAQAQFAPAGTQWHYSNTMGGMYQMPYNPMLFEHYYRSAVAEKDTTINGILYSKITGNGIYGPKIHLLRTQGNKVYYYLNGKDNLMMDFAVSAGDSVDLDIWINRSISWPTPYSVPKRVLVDSVTYELNYAAGDSLKTVHFHYSLDSAEHPGWPVYYNCYTEKIINTEMSQSRALLGPPASVVFFSADVSALRCFTAGSYKFSSHWWDTYFVKPYNLSCDRDFGPHTGAGNRWNDKLAEVWPNPFHGVLNLNISENDTRIDLYDITGKLMMSHKLVAGNHELQVDVPAGLYLLHMTSALGESTFQKLFCK